MLNIDNNSILVTQLIADDLRKRYIRTFIDTNSAYYAERIEAKKRFKDGWCYTGYLWDCYKNFTLKSEIECEQFLKSKYELFVFWDIHSSERILIPDYWKFPKESVLFFSYWDHRNNLKDLPEDIYLFDKSFDWTIAFTHEENFKGQRFCYFATP